MRKTNLTIALGVLLVGVGVAAAKGSSQRAVKQTFDSYTRALKARDGRTAAELVDRDTLAYFDQMRQHALRSRAQTVKGLNVMDKLMVLSIRAQLGAARLRTTSGKQFFALTVSRGMVAKNPGANQPLGLVTVRGNDAEAAIAVPPASPVKPRWHFRKENGRWKLRLVPLLRMVAPYMKQMLRNIDPDENAALLKIIKMVATKPVRPVGPALWNP